MNFRTAVIIGLGSTLFTACSDVGFHASKIETLTKASVFGADANGEIHQPGGTNGTLNQPGGTGGTNGTLNQPYMVRPGQVSQPIERMCSQKRSLNFTNFKRAKFLNETISLQVNGKDCTSDTAKIESLIMQPSVSISNLKSLCPARVPATGQVNVSLIINGSDYASEYNSTSKLSILYANREGPPIMDDIPEEMGDANCTAYSSPIVIHLASNAKSVSYVELTNLEGGIDFDLLGANNAHRNVRIGWFTNNDFAMLALPNQHGEVLGIDELFGDNTEGPDGQFAANGYAALAKYDGASADGHFRLTDADGRIDRADPVYSHLRLWRDENLDGIAQPNELIHLADAGIAFIDLEFSESYSETDQYGNQTLMKSVVGFDNGALDLVFDLWFHYELLN